MAKALNCAALSEILLAKQSWSDVVGRTSLLNRAIERLRRSQADCVETDRAVVSGNLGYALFLLNGRTDEVVQATTTCLSLGGEKMLEAQRTYANFHRVEPVDTEYLALLDELSGAV